jgi:hypothetical protein
MKCLFAITNALPLTVVSFTMHNVIQRMIGGLSSLFVFFTPEFLTEFVRCVVCRASTCAWLYLLVHSTPNTTYRPF